MNLEIESIKALEPGKIYWITISEEFLHKYAEDLDEMIKKWREAGKEQNINFIFAIEGIKPVSVPEGIEIVQK